MDEKIRTEADYFARNTERMRYPKFRRQHLFVGSGVIEAGCKTVIGSRRKQSGMSGPSGEPTPSWRCAAPISMDASRTIERSAARPGRREIHFYVARPRTSAQETVANCESNEIQLLRTKRKKGTPASPIGGFRLL
jgi:hypothetical protein